MSKKAQSTAAEAGQQTLVPKLRFPEFRNAPGWSSDLMSGLFSERSERGQTDLPLLSLTDKEGIILQSDSNRKNNSNSDKSKYLVVRKGDIAYNTMRMWEGRSALVTIDGLVSPAYTVCVPNKKADSKFFSFYFKTNPMIDLFHRYSQGLVKDTYNLKYDKFASLPVFFPGANEQQKIADCLSSLDELIATQAGKVEALKAHKKGLMQLLFPAEGQTIPQLRFPEFRTAPGWQPSLISELCKPFSGGTPATTKPSYYGGSIPFIRSAEIDRDNTELTLSDEGLSNSSAKMVRKGDVLVALYGANSGEVAISKINGAINQAILCLQTEDNSAFIYQYLLFKMATFVATHVQGGQGNLSGEIVKSIPIMLPQARAEKQKIADCLSSLDELIAAHAGKVEALKAHKKGLMQQLFPSSTDEVMA